METFKALFIASLKSQTEYRFNFIMDIILSGLAIFSDFMITLVILSNFKDMAGWNLGEIALIYSIIEGGWGIFRLFGEGLHRFQELTLSGRFDVLLIRPVSTVKQVMLQKFQFRRLGVIGQAVGVGIMGALYAGMASPGFFVIYCILIVLSALLIFSVNLILSAIAFWTIRNEDILALASYSMRTAAYYPLNIYADFVKIVLTFIVPMATAAYYPMSYLSGKTDSIFALIAPVLSLIVFMPLSFWLWKQGEKHYSSTGS